jgi:hypothetical protein
VQGVLLVGRPRLARLVAPLRVRAVGEAAPADAAWLADATRAAGLDPARVRVVDAPDPGFTGGWIGVRAPVLWVPAHWHALPREVLVAQLARQRPWRRSGCTDAACSARSCGTRPGWRRSSPSSRRPTRRRLRGSSPWWPA